MRRNSGLDRKRNRRFERTRVLVATEGTQTEEQYFGLLVQHLRATGVKHWPITPHGVGRDPMRVLRAAVAKRDADREDSFDSVWVVVDVDDHATLQSCLELALKEGIKVVVSNPCFEIWLLWHLRDHFRSETGPALQNLLKSEGYSGKAVPANFPIKEYSTASARAAAADPKCRAGSVGRNPSSAMPELLEYLLSA